MDYILSCFHGINPLNDNMFANYYDKKTKKYVSKKCKLVTFCEEFDLALLQIYKLNQSSSISIDNFTQLFNIPNSEYKINLLDNDSNSNNIPKWHNDNCYYQGIIFDRYTGFLCPHMPYVVMDLKKSTIKKLSSSSGSLVYNNKFILGMLVREDIITKKLKILHSSVIYRFLNEFIMTGKFNGLISVVGDFTECEFDLDNKHVHGLHIDNTYDINYNNVYNQVKTKRNNLKNGDIIYAINNIPIIDGCIFDKKYNIPIKFSTYVSLKYKIDDSIKLDILRLKPKTDDDYDKKTVNINARPLNTMKYIQLSDFSSLNINSGNKKMSYEFAGFIFAELTESIIKEYRNKKYYS